MKNGQRAIEKLWYDVEHHEWMPEIATTFDAIDDAERRATLVFEMLLTVLSCPNGPCFRDLSPT